MTSHFTGGGNDALFTFSITLLRNHLPKYKEQVGKKQHNSFVFEYTASKVLRIIINWEIRREEEMEGRLMFSAKIVKHPNFIECRGYVARDGVGWGCPSFNEQTFPARCRGEVQLASDAFCSTTST